MNLGKVLSEGRWLLGGDWWEEVSIGGAVFVIEELFGEAVFEELVEEELHGEGELAGKSFGESLGLGELQGEGELLFDTGL